MTRDKGDKMMKCSITCAAAMFILPLMVAAESIHKWVDKDGKVHYSQTRPKDTDATKVKVDPPPPADAEPPMVNGERICLSYECYAIKLNQERVERERGYAKARAENELCLI